MKYVTLLHLHKEASLFVKLIQIILPLFASTMNRFGCYQLDLTQPPPPLNYDIQVIISEKIGWLCGFRSSEKGEGQTEKEKSARQMKLFA